MKLFVPEKSKKHGQRNDKVATKIRECLAMSMLRGDFPVISRQKNASIPPCQITLTYVELSPDLKYATVFFTLSDDLKKVEALTFFELQTSYFRSLIAKQMQLKFVPNLVFKIDESVEYAKKIEDLLKH